MFLPLREQEEENRVGKVEKNSCAKFTTTVDDDDAHITDKVVSVDVCAYVSK